MKLSGFENGPTDFTLAVMRAVQRERKAQHRKWGPQHHFDGTSEDWSLQAEYWKRINDEHVELTGDTDWTSILAEEFFEALAETDQHRLRAELIQVAAVAVAWVEDIDSRKDSRE